MPETGRKLNLRGKIPTNSDLLMDKRCESNISEIFGKQEPDTSLKKKPLPDLGAEHFACTANRNGKLSCLLS